MSAVQIALVVVSCLLGLSEGLALIPAIKANSIVQAIINVLGSLKDALSK